MIEPDEIELTHALDPIGEVSGNSAAINVQARARKIATDALSDGA